MPKVNPSRREILAGAISLGAALALPGPAFGADSFRVVPNAFRMRMHWYIFGPAWTAAESRRQLELMAKANIGGVLIFPTYPIAPDTAALGIKNEKYLSPEFLSVFQSVTEDAKRLGLTVDIVLGTGWPYGGPLVTLDQSAHSIRMSRLEPVLREGEILIGRYPSSEGTGEMEWFYSAPTRMEVKRAALGAEGWVVDHYRESSLQQFLADVGDKLLDSVPRGAVRSIFCDSLEVYRATWTADFPAIFEKQRGYDIRPRLPALFNSAHPDSRDLRHDFWRTLSNLAADEFIAPLSEWAHRKGVTTQVEAYGTPPVNLSSYRHVDVPVGEHYEWKEFSSSRWASSGGHLAGKPVILAESWTWLGSPNRFGDTLEELKLCSDLHFLSGINALYGLTYAYSPIELGSPGWLPYFGPATNHTSPYWPYFSYLADYVNRVTFILQQGKPVADVAVYLPAEDAMAEANTEQLLMNWAVRDRLSSNGPPPEFSLKNALHYESDVVKGIITNGYAFDGIDTFTMNSGMRVEQGRLRMGDGDYSVLVLPNLTAIDPESLRMIEAFVEGGGTVIATKRLPERAYGMRQREARNDEVKKRVKQLFENRQGKGRAIFCRDEEGSFREALHTSQPPDIRFTRASGHVSFVHRRTADREFYFLANTSEEPQRLEATFRVGAKVPERWDLQSGEVHPIVVFELTPTGTRVVFDLGPRESKVLAFTNEARGPQATTADLALESGGTKVFSNGDYHVGPRKISVRGIPASQLLNLRWTLRLGSKTFPLGGLKSWTEIPEARFFSGRGVYEAEFDAIDHVGMGVVLDLGQVRETADVHLNGEPVGVAWMRPHRLDVTRSLRKGTNQLRVDVTNLLINEVLGKGPIDYSEVYRRYGKRFPAGDEWEVIRDPLPSGLLGPVRLVFYRLVTL